MAKRNNIEVVQTSLTIIHIFVGKLIKTKYFNTYIL